MPGLRTLSVTLAAAGGARDEDEARSGWSHLLEHLVFKGAGDMGAREIVERIEAEGGSINAATGHERTSFSVRALAGGLPLALQVLSDLVFRPTLNEDEIVREKDVVAQEIAEAFDTPDDQVFEMAQAKAFAGQSLGRPILGSVESLAPADRGGIDVWRRSLYAPNRMALCVSGAVDEQELLQMAERWFGDQPASPALERAPATFEGGAARLARSIEQANLVFTLPAPGHADPDLPATRLFSEILGGGMASRLFQEAREQRGLAYAIDSWFEAYADVGVLGVYAGSAAGKAREVAEVTAQVIRDMAGGVTDAELARAKVQLKAGHYIAEESPASRADRYAAQQLIYGGPVSTEDSVARLEAVTVGDLRRVADRTLEARRSASAVLGPRAALPAAAAFDKALFG
ncbi:MAG TPA: pitrilysin family protein [Caulobacteraceae bacterium]